MPTRSVSWSEHRYVSPVSSIVCGVIYLVPLSYLWWLFAATLGYAWGATLTFFLPLVILAAWRWYERRPTQHTEREVALPLSAG